MLSQFVYFLQALKVVYTRNQWKCCELVEDICDDLYKKHQEYFQSYTCCALALNIHILPLPSSLSPSHSSPSIPLDPPLDSYS